MPCAAARLSSDVSGIKLAFSIPPEQPAPNFAASWNVAPTEPAAGGALRRAGRDTPLRSHTLGAPARLAKDIKISYSTFSEVSLPGAYPYRSGFAMLAGQIAKLPPSPPGQSPGSKPFGLNLKP